MNTKILFVLLSAFLFVAGFGGALWLGDRQTASQGNDAAALYAQEIKALGTRITSLEQQLGDQSRSLAALQQELAARPSDPVPAVDSAISVKQVAEAVKREVVQGGSPPLVQANGEPTEVLEHSVRAVMDQLRKEEKAAEAEKDKEQRAKRVKDRVDRLTPELGLDAYQSSQLTAVLLETDEKFNALRGNGRPGGFGAMLGDPGAPNPFMEIMSQRDEKLKVFLSSSQMDKLDQLEPGRRFMQRGNNQNNPNQDANRQRRGRGNRSNQDGGGTDGGNGN